MPVSLFSLRLCLLSASAVIASFASAQTYRLVEIGTLGGANSWASDINEAGQVSGKSEVNGTQQYRGFLYSSGSLQELGNLGGSDSLAYGMNNHGASVGYSYLSGGPYVATLYSNGGVTNLGTLGGETGVGQEINDLGQVIGYAMMPGNAVNAAFLYSNGSMTNLGTLGGSFARATGINESGAIVGQSTLAGGDTMRAFLYMNGTMTDIGTGVHHSSASSINESGQAVGYYYDQNFHIRAGSYQNGSWSDLGTLGGTRTVAYNLNDSGQIVGGATLANGIQTGFLHTGGAMFDISTLLDGSATGWTQFTPTAINNSGLIAATAMKDGVWRAVILQPVPEPLTLIVLGAGAFMLSRRQRLKK